MDISKEDRPCSVCRKVEYAAWIAERQPATKRRATLNEKGQCCGRKPIVYKRPHRFFCTRCCAEFDPSGEQVGNWAWQADGKDYVATSPTHDYARAPVRSSLG